MFIKTNSNNQLYSLGCFCSYQIVPYSTSSDLDTKELSDKLNNLESNTFQSAGNLTGSSETIRKLSDKEIEWLAGVLDGDGNFDIQNLKSSSGKIKRTLKQIRITQHPRDADILARVKYLLGGSIKPKGNRYILWTISTKKLMLNCISLINGHMRLKIPGFKESCELLGVTYKEADYIIKEDSAYLAGLTDTDGSVVFNHPGNKIVLTLEFQQNEFSEKLDLSQVVQGAKPSVFEFDKRNQTKDKVFFSKRIIYDNVAHMPHIYQYFLKNRLYSNFKFFRVTKIKEFLDLRHFNKHPENSPEFKLYHAFITNYFKHLNESKPLPAYISSKKK